VESSIGLQASPFRGPTPRDVTSRDTAAIESHLDEAHSSIALAEEENAKPPRRQKSL
jgi:hypothetical protein